MKNFTSIKQKIGKNGEDQAEMFLVKQGFSIIERNFSTRFGEIDIIALLNNCYYFFEVKTITVSHETLVTKKLLTMNGEIYSFRDKNVSRETSLEKPQPENNREQFDREYRKIKNPFQNISYFKVNRLIKTAEIYLSSRNVSRETRWQIDGIGVYLDTETNQCLFERIEHLSVR